MSEAPGNSPAENTAPTSAMPQVRPLSAADIRECLKLGFADFRRAPLFGLVIGGIFAAIGIIIVLGLTALDLPWMTYPFAIGFPLIGPFAAVGLYDVSRRLSSGEKPVWRDVLSIVWAQRGRELTSMAFVILFVFWVWMYQVRLLIALFLGLASFASFEEFLTVVLTTEDGWLFLAVGHVVGAVLALVLFSITVVAMPLLTDRDVDIVTAMITSVKAVIASPVVMLGWGVVVTLSVIAACLPFFLGLLVVLPVLGHATWHLYRKAVVT
ncbi:MAG: DUF2189 domain-containing protein [Parvibaculaceae bacterium]